MLTFLSLSFFTVESNAQSYLDGVIGTISNGQTILTMNENATKSSWAQMLKTEADIDVVFQTLEIKKEDTIYYLVARDSDRSVNSVVELVIQGGDLVVARSDGDTTTVTCSGNCISGCDPFKLNENWKCTPCQNTMDCKKTVTVTSTDG